MKHRSLYLAAYDIADANRLQQALRLVKGYATGGQKSVFECFLSPVEKRNLLRDVAAVLDETEDRFFIVRLDPRAKLFALGLAVPAEDPPFFYHG